MLDKLFTFDVSDSAGLTYQCDVRQSSLLSKIYSISDPLAVIIYHKFNLEFVDIYNPQTKEMAYGSQFDVEVINQIEKYLKNINFV